MEEVWLPVGGYEGLYEVSNLGRVKSFKGKNPDGKILKPGYTRTGYQMLTLWKDRVYKGSMVHRLVAKTFIVNTNDYPVVNHLNGIKSDNKIDNLEWTTYSENNLHAIRTGLRKKVGETNYNVKLTHKQVLEIRAKYANGNTTMKKLGEFYGVSFQLISQIINRKKYDFLPEELKAVA